jgi:hypothetical protein
MERADNGGRMNVGNIALNPAESLNILAQGFTFLLGDDIQVTFLTRSLMTAGKGANKLVAKIRPRRNGILRQVHQPRPDVGLEHQREVVG